MRGWDFIQFQALDQVLIVSGVLMLAIVHGVAMPCRKKNDMPRFRNLPRSCIGFSQAVHVRLARPKPS